MLSIVAIVTLLSLSITPKHYPVADGFVFKLFARHRFFDFMNGAFFPGRGDFHDAYRCKKSERR